MKSSAKILSLVLTLALALAVFAPAAMAKTYVTEKSNNFHFTGVKRREAAPAEEATAGEVVVEEAAAEEPAQPETDELPANARLMAIIEDELSAERSISTYAVYDGDTLTFGDTVTLIAVLNGYDSLAYDLKWQSSPDNKAWTDVAGETAASYTFTITEERKKSWDFTTPYYTDYVTVLVEDASGIKTLADLADKKVGVSSGSTSAKALVKAMIEAGVLSGDGFDADSFDPATWTDGVSFAQYDDYPTISTALSAGEVDAFCVDKSILAVYHTDGRSYIDDKFSPQEYGIATVKGSGMSELCEKLVTGWLSDGTIDSLIAENGIA